MEDGFAPLDGRHPAGGKRLAVADAIDLVEDRDLRVTWSQKVSMEGVIGRSAPLPSVTVRPAATSDWAATWPPKTRMRCSGAEAPKEVHLESLQVKMSTSLSKAAVTSPSCSPATEPHDTSDKLRICGHDPS